MHTLLRPSAALPPGKQANSRGSLMFAQFLNREIAGLEKVKVVVALGKIGFDAYFELLETSRPAA